MGNPDEIPNDILLAEYQREFGEGVIKEAKEQLTTIRESLLDLVDKIKREKPDAVVFLDKGSRIFAVPIRKYLHSLGNSQLPEFRFYNDVNAKEEYCFDSKFELENVAREDFEPMRGKKLFFIDETYSVGHGAATILELAKLAGVDATYIALSKDPAPTGDQEEALPSFLEHEAFIKESIRSGKVLIYPNHLNTMFSKTAGKYLYGADLETRTNPHVIRNPQYNRTSKMPEASRYAVSNYGMPQEEYEKKESEFQRNTIAKLHELILKTLNGESLEG
jgi:hypothetical protein